MSKRKPPETLLQAVTYFADEDVSLDFVAKLRWPEGKQVCPKCGSENAHYFLKTRRKWKCRDCRKQFSIKVGTIFEDSPLPLSKWLPAMWLLANCKNGISSYELARALGVTQKSAWFMLSRIRLAMQTKTFEKATGTNEIDETFIGGRAKNMHASKRKKRITGRGTGDKTAVMGILTRGEERPSTVRAQMIPNTKADTLRTAARANIEAGSTVFTDGEGAYKDLERDYTHAAVSHSHGEYVRGDAHTNGIENFWALLKRSLNGTYVSVDPFHLARYVHEQAFRFNMRADSDLGRFCTAVAMIVGKRLTYKGLTTAGMCRR